MEHRYLVARKINKIDAKYVLTIYASETTLI